MDVKFRSILLLIILNAALVDFSLSIPRDLSQNVMWTWKNNSFYAFRGIRYAEAPVNELRYKVRVEPLHIKYK